MGLETKLGPSISLGQPPAIGPFGPGDYNSDASPDGSEYGYGLLDSRYRVSGGGQNPQPGAGPVAIYAGLFAGPIYALDQAPSQLAVANIAIAANPTSGTALTLVTSSGAGITVLAAAFTVLQTGKVVPVGSLAIDGNPGLMTTAQSGSVKIADPTKALARCVSLTGVTSGSGGAVTVRGYDLYGYPQSETITMTGGATTTNGKKAFKWIASVTPGFTDTHTISVGTSDVFGIPFYVSQFADANWVWNNITGLTAQLVAGDTTTPATATTGDVRGTIAVATTASDGTRKLSIQVLLKPANLANAAGLNVGLYGVTPV